MASQRPAGPAASPDALFSQRREMMKTRFLRFLRQERAVTAIEYALLGGLIAVVIVIAVGLAGAQLKTLFDTIQTQITQASS
jgi:pilus assembly protein Flp/PilA